MKRRALVTGLPGVLETVVAMTATVLLVALVSPAPGPLVLGAVLAMILSRSKLVDTWRGRLESLVVLPLLAVVTSGVALLFVVLPVVGAVAFTAGLFLSVWLRRFGPTWRRIGALIALPFVTLLVAPVHLGAGAAPLAALVAALVSVIALAVVVGVRLLGGLAWARSPAPREQPLPPGALRPIASTRMALQLAASLATAFVLGFWLFPEHWGWVVLTAYLVQSGNRGRADVVYKSGLRVVGAVAGTLLALLVAGVRLEGPPLVAVLLVSLAVGLFLRGISYAFWALVVTLVLTLLQGGAVDLWPRVLAILVGAACGVLASWFILPIRSEGVLRRRIAAVLAQLDEGASLAPDEAAGPSGDSPPSLAPIDEVAAPFVFLARVPFAPRRWRRAGEWVVLVREIAARDVPASARPALAAARRALREPDAITPALGALLAELD